jgi:hypothetical protein
MSIRIDVSVDDAAALLDAGAYGPGALLRLERAADEAGPFTETSTQGIVAGIDAYALWDAGGSATSWYRSRVTNAGATILSEYSDPFQVDSTPSVTTVAQVRALVKTSLSDDDLQELIDREEALLAAEIGALSGSRTETFVITGTNLDQPVRLRRATGAVSVTEANVTITDVRLSSNGRVVTRLAEGGWFPASWRGVVEVTFTPNDTARVVTWVIELVRARLAETGFRSETDGAYSYDRGTASYDDVWARAVADILGSPRSGSRGLRSIVMSTAGPSGWVGSTRP